MLEVSMRHQMLVPSMANGMGVFPSAVVAVMTLVTFIACGFGQS
jgi:hypothetical protein